MADNEDQNIATGAGPAVDHQAEPRGSFVGGFGERTAVLAILLSGLPAGVCIMKVHVDELLCRPLTWDAIARLHHSCDDCVTIASTVSTPRRQRSLRNNGALLRPRHRYTNGPAGLHV